MFSLCGGGRGENASSFDSFPPTRVVSPSSVPSVFSLIDSLTLQQAEQSYSHEEFDPMMSPFLLFFLTLFIVVAILHHQHSRSHSFFSFLFLSNNYLPFSFFFFVGTARCRKKVFFGFDLSINRKSLKCPFCI